MRALSLACALLLATMAVSSDAWAQHVLTIDYESGRDVINDPLRAMDSHLFIIDQARRMIFVHDSEEPSGIMGFSLDTGDRLQTLRVAQGSGPAELDGLPMAMAVASEGGLYLRGFDSRVVHIDASGQVAYAWTPASDLALSMCDIGGQPAVPALEGVLRRVPGGGVETFGAPEPRNRPLSAGMAEEASSQGLDLFRTGMACADGVAYVARNGEDGPRSVTAYRVGGRRDQISVPPDLTSGRAYWSRRLDLGFDGRGHLLVLTGGRGEVPGAIIDPGTGCYALIRNRSYEMLRELVGVYQDSAVVFHFDSEEVELDGRTSRRIYDRGSRVSLHPLVPDDGSTCPRMAPSLEGDLASEPSLDARPSSYRIIPHRWLLDGLNAPPSVGNPPSRGRGAASHRPSSG